MKTRNLELSPSEIASYYRRQAPKVKQQGKEWRGPCPIHGGKRDSFAVNSDSGQWYCHSECGRGGSVFDLEMALTGVSFLEAKREIASIVGRPKGSDASLAAIATTYPYRDEKGKLLYEVVRYEPKDFRQRRPDGRGGWTWKLNGARRVPYRLPELVKPETETVYVVEGEKDVATLERWGLVATTAGAAGRWQGQFSDYLRGKTVLIVPDNDDQGRKDALEKAESLLSRAKEVRVLELPELEEKGDVTDWKGAGKTREDLLVVVEAAKPLDTASLRDLNMQWFPEPGPSVRSSGISSLSELPSIWQLKSKVEWLIEDFLAIGSVTLLSSESGVGKSWVAYWLAGSVAHGRPVFGRKVRQRPVLYIDAENPSYVVSQRVREGLGFPETPELYIRGGWVDSPPPRPDFLLLKEFARERRGLIIYDPLVAFQTGSEISANDVRQFMQGFRDLANAGATVLVLHHSGKAETAREYRGSSDYKASVDTAYTLTSITPNRQRIDRLMLKCFKSRITPGQDFGLQFREGFGFELCDVPESARTRSADEVIDEILQQHPGSNQKEIIKYAEGTLSKNQVIQALKSDRWPKEPGRGSELLYRLADGPDTVAA